MMKYEAQTLPVSWRWFYEQSEPPLPRLIRTTTQVDF